MMQLLMAYKWPQRWGFASSLGRAVKTCESMKVWHIVRPQQPHCKISLPTDVFCISNLHTFLCLSFFFEQVSKRGILSSRLTLLGRPSTAHGSFPFFDFICSSMFLWETVLALHHSIIFIPFTEDRRKENLSKKVNTHSQLDATWTQTCLAHGIVKTTRTNYVTRCEALGQDCGTKR